MGEKHKDSDLGPIEFDSTKLIITVLILIFTIVLFISYRRRKAARRGILLTGLCGSGKTLLFSQLIHKKYVETYTSIKENIGNYFFNNEVMKIIDIPGHERLRYKHLESFKETARGIIFVVDSLTIQQDIRDAAEFLYNILVDPVINKISPKILILCNKQDQTLAKGSTVIKSIFEKELNTLRMSKASQLDDSSNTKAKLKLNLIGGDKDLDFDFSLLKYKIEFAKSFAHSKDGSVNIEPLEQWLTTLM